jgi:predicted ATPase
LAARLDRLEPTPRLVLERASVEGRRFRIAALRALAPDVPAEGFEDAIEVLDRHGLLQPEDEATGSWRFAHALVMDVAYGGLSKELRADLPERLADWPSPTVPAGSSRARGPGRSRRWASSRLATS